MKERKINRNDFSQSRIAIADALRAIVARDQGEFSLGEVHAMTGVKTTAIEQNLRSLCRFNHLQRIEIIDAHNGGTVNNTYRVLDENELLAFLDKTLGLGIPPSALKTLKPQGPKAGIERRCLKCGIKFRAANKFLRCCPLCRDQNKRDTPDDYACGLRGFVQ